jgi:hypothetical protein
MRAAVMLRAKKEFMGSVEPTGYVVDAPSLEAALHVAEEQHADVRMYAYRAIPVADDMKLGQIPTVYPKRG